MMAPRQLARGKRIEDLDRLHQQEAQATDFPPSKWRPLSGKEQTDALFDKEIVERMGRDFSVPVFGPAVRRVYEAGQGDRDIRDTIRRDWKP
jgi:hypothetical protein